MSIKWSARFTLLAAPLAAFLAFVATVYAGGWAIVTVRDLPEYAVEGERIELRFVVRQHGISPLDGLEPKVVATLGTDDVEAPATATTVIEVPAMATAETGEYAAGLRLPRPGLWQLQILDAYGSFSLPDLNVVAGGDTMPEPLLEETLGKRLFVAKGCIGCHVNREIEVPNLVSMGPDLTGSRFPESYLKRFLADPASAAGTDSDTEYGNMPDLDLTEREIAVLVSFMNRDR